MKKLAMALSIFPRRLSIVAFPSKVFAILMTVALASGQTIEPIPHQAARPTMDYRRIQKSITYGDSTIFLQSRKKGIKTNDLMIMGKDGVPRYLCHNPYFITDFCLSRRGILYYSEAGRDHGYAVGTRGHEFRLKQIDLKTVPEKIEPLLPGKTFSEPQRLELNHNEKLLCFADHFGMLHAISLMTGREMKIDLDGIDLDKIQGLYLSDDKRSFIAGVNTGTTERGAFIWKNRKFPLPAH